jgi:hypothetical protein
LHELFGAELSSRQIPTTTLTAEMLAACRADSSSAGSSAVPSAGVRDPTPLAAQRASEPDEYSISIGAGAPVQPPSRWLSWVAASVGTATLLLLLVARGGGARSQGATLPPPPPVASVAASPPGSDPAKIDPPPSAVTAAAEPQGPVQPQSSEPAGSVPGHHARWSGKGRIARGLSVDPFAEAASRVGR